MTTLPDGDDVGPARLGWIGTGRMGFAMVCRLLDAGRDVTVWNRTRAKAEPLAARGAKLAERPADLAGCDVVFTMVAAGPEVDAVLFGADGVLTAGVLPPLVVDCSTVDLDDGASLRQRAAEAGVDLLAAPVSGNGRAVEAGALTMAASGPRDAFERARPHLETIARGVTYVGEGERARLVKVAHNLVLGIVTQAMAEVTVLVEKGGVSRHDFLAFLNQSVMGSVFTRYKTPAFVNLDLTPTFTPVLLRKDFELGLAAGRRLDAPLPVAGLVHQIIAGAVAEGHVDDDFAVMLLLQARSAGLELQSENREVSDGFDQPT